MAVPMNSALLAVLQRATPMPKHAAVLLAQHGQVTAGGPRGRISERRAPERL